MYSPLRARKLDPNGYLELFISFEKFGDPSTLSCDRDSQGDVFFADMSHSVSRSRALDDIADGLLPQWWMGKKSFQFIKHTDVILTANGRLKHQSGGSLKMDWGDKRHPKRINMIDKGKTGAVLTNGVLMLFIVATFFCNEPPVEATTLLVYSLIFLVFFWVLATTRQTIIRAQR